MSNDKIVLTYFVVSMIITSIIPWINIPIFILPWFVFTYHSAFWILFLYFRFIKGD